MGHTLHRLQGLTALVIEDDQDVALAIEAMLEELGAVPMGHVATVQQALEALIARRPDIAVLDANLQGEPAYRVVQTLGATGIPFVVVTGFRPHALPPVFAEHRILKKPFRQESLGEALAQAVYASGRFGRGALPR